MYTTPLNATYFKRYLYHNFMITCIGFILLIFIELINPKKTFTIHSVLVSFVICFIISCLLLIPELIFCLFYLKLKRVNIVNNELVIDNQSIHPQEIIAITPITYSRNRWFANVIELELKDDKMCYFDQSVFSNENSQSLKILLEYFPELKSRVKENTTRRKLHHYE
ncbi:MAG TPA: hypothetical protein VIG94_01975 [Faecalibacter sp.]